MRSSLITLGFALLALSTSACGGIDPGEQDSEVAVTEPTAELDAQELAVGSYCRDTCTNTTSCNQQCSTPAGQWITCGQWGTCAKPPPPCNYVPVTGQRICGMDFDGHLWGTRLEVEQEALYRDSAGQARCGEKYIQTINSTSDCVGVWGSSNAFNCCVARFGNTCYSLVPGSCHR